MSPKSAGAAVAPLLSFRKAPMQSWAWLDIACATQGTVTLGTVTTELDFVILFGQERQS